MYCTVLIGTRATDQLIFALTSFWKVMKRSFKFRGRTDYRFVDLLHKVLNYNHDLLMLHVCPIGGIRFFPRLWCEDSREVHPWPRGSHQMEEGADCLARKWWASCEEDTAEPAAGARYRCTTGGHISYNGLWGPGGGAADPDLHRASHQFYHMWEPAIWHIHEYSIN